MITTMKRFVVTILPIIHLSSSNQIITEKFLMDFFRNKQVSILLNSCWNRESIVNFMKFSDQQLNKIAVYKEQNRIFFNRSHNIYFVGDLTNCQQSLNTLEQFNRNNILHRSVEFLLTIPIGEFGGFSKKIEKFMIGADLKIIIAIIEHDGCIKLYRPYKIRKTTNQIIWNYYGNWSVHGLFFNKRLIYSERMNFQQTKFLMGLTILNNNTYQQLHDFRDVHIDSFAKLSYGVMELIFQIHNISFTIVSNPSFGYYNEATGKYNGLIRMIYDGEIDIGGCFYMYESRYRAVDFLPTGLQLDHCFLVRKPSTSYVKNIFFLCFTWDAWLAILLELIIFSITIRIILNFERRLQSNTDELQYSISDVSLIALEALCQQGTTTEPRTISGRIIVLIFFTAFMFLYVSYSANIVVLLQSTTPLQNLEQLLNSRIEAAGEKVNYSRTYFEAPKTGILRDLYLNKIYPDRYLSLEDGMKRLQAETFAYHLNLFPAYVYILYNYTNYQTCSLQRLPGYMEINDAYVGIAKKSPYNELFKISLLRINEYGLRNRIVTRTVRKPICHSHSSSFESIGIYDCHQVFWICIIGVGLSISILIIERSHKILLSIVNEKNNKKPTNLKFNIQRCR